MVPLKLYTLFILQNKVFSYYENIMLLIAQHYVCYTIDRSLSIYIINFKFTILYIVRGKQTIWQTNSHVIGMRELTKSYI